MKYAIHLKYVGFIRKIIRVMFEENLRNTENKQEKNLLLRSTY